MNLHLRLSLVVCGLLLPVMAAAAQSRPTPNFSGYWRLDVEKSDFGGAPALESAGYVIRHIGP